MSVKQDVDFSLCVYTVFEEPCQARLRASCHDGALSESVKITTCFSLGRRNQIVSASQRQSTATQGRVTDILEYTQAGSLPKLHTWFGSPSIPATFPTVSHQTYIYQPSGVRIFFWPTKLFYMSWKKSGSIWSQFGSKMSLRETAPLLPTQRF